MRYFAILKDSFREAVDSKVMYVLFAVSTLAILFVATLSFKSLPARNTMDQFFPDAKLNGIPLMFVVLYTPELNSAGMDPESLKSKEKGGDDLLEQLQLLSQFRLERVEQMAGEADAPEGEYLLTIAELFPRLRKKDDPNPFTEKDIARVRAIFQKADDLGFIRIGDIAGDVEWPDDRVAPRVRYRVTLHGTPSTYRIWVNEPSLLFGAYPIEVLSASLAYQLYVLAQNVLALGAWVAILTGVVITSFYIPSMVSKGTVDMLLVKPIQRWAILTYKYVGGLTFIFLNTAYAIGGFWLVLGLRTGVWANGLALLVLTMTFFFAILYAISTFVGVATRSTIASIIVTIGAWFLFFGIGVGDRNFEAKRKAEVRQEKRDQKPLPPEKRWGDGRIARSLSFWHAIMPRTEELNLLNDRIVYYSFMTSVMDIRKFDSGDRPWWESVFVSLLWIAVFLGLACFWFSVKDY